MSSAFIDKIWVWASGKGESTFYNLHEKYAAKEIIIQDFFFIFWPELITMVLHQKKQSVVDTASLPL